MKRRWIETMPGRDRLAEELGVSRKTVALALTKLEEEGLLVGQGAGSKRRIVLSKVTEGVHPLRIEILIDDTAAQGEIMMVDFRHALEAAGHSVRFSPKGLNDLKMDVKSVAGLANKSDAEAWVVVAASREVLAWFAAQPTPVFALFGRRRSLKIASVGPDKVAIYRSVARELHQLGHRRIVLLAREMGRLPEPRPPEAAFLEELRSLGQTVGKYNIPDWEDNKEGFHTVLNSLFERTPPTALMIDEVFLMAAAQQFLAQRCLQVPEDVSLICADPDPAFDWCEPSISHIAWSSRPVVRRIVNWAANIARGVDDRRQTNTKAEFVRGGTVGRAP
jgi:DNA-binding Lrp family transcriptional regulator